MLSEPYGVREAGRICLTACHPNRAQAKEHTLASLKAALDDPLS